MKTEGAHRRLGNLALVREQVRDVDTFRWLGDLGQDGRYALRQLRRNPGFALAAILTLGLGIGTTTAVFSVVDAVVLRPLSYSDSSRLVTIDEWTPGVGSIPVNGLHFQEWRRTATSFDQMALIGGLNVNVTDSSEPERLPAARVSSELFPLLGVQPQYCLGSARLRFRCVDQPASSSWLRLPAAERSGRREVCADDSNGKVQAPGVEPACGRSHEVWEKHADIRRA